MNTLLLTRGYVVKLTPEGTAIHRAGGCDLMNTGFTVRMADPVDAKIYEVSRIEAQ